MDLYSGILEGWHTPSKQHFIDSRYGKTFVIESGPENGNPVVLLHGTGSNSAMWLADAMTLSDQYRVFAIDIIGECGHSDESRPPFTGGNYYYWLRDILYYLKIEKTSIVGCSLGGWIALDFAIHEPQMTEKLVLIATAGITPLKAKTIFLIMLSSLLGRQGFNMINRLVYGDIDIDPKALKFASLVKDHFIPRNDILKIFDDKELERIESPTLFIGGENDCFYDSQATANRINEIIRNSSNIVLAGTGHILTGQTEFVNNFLTNGYL